VHAKQACRSTGFIGKVASEMAAMDAASAVERFHKADGKMADAEQAVSTLESEFNALGKALASYRQTDEHPAAKATSGPPHGPK
jgi:hypothetical protein